MARRLQLYWFPLASIATVVGAALLLDLPGRGAMVRSSEHGFQIGRFGTIAFVSCSVILLAVLWTIQAVTDRPRQPAPWSHHVYYVAFGVLYADFVFLAGAHGETATTAGSSVWLFAGIIPAAWAGRHVVSRLEDARARAEGEWATGSVRRPPLALRRSETALWTGTGRARTYSFTVYLGPVLIASAIAFTLVHRGATPVDAFYAVSWILMFLYGFGTASVGVTIREQEVLVEAGPFRFPLWRIPLADVQEARVEDVRPRAYGGLGYHAKGGRRGLVVRAGPGLLIRRKAGRDVLVTVDGPDEGAALLNALVERRSPARSGVTTG